MTTANTASEVESRLGLDQCRLVYAGLDWLGISAWGHWHSREVYDGLVYLQRQAKLENKPVVGFVGETECKVWPHGTQSGITFYQIHAQVSGCTLLVNPVDSVRDGEGMPAVMVDVPGLVWTRLGNAALQLPKELMKWLCFTPAKTVAGTEEVIVRRIDVCWDFIGNLAPLCDWVFADGMTVNKRLSFQRYKSGQVDTGLSIQGGDTKVRIYNKREELRSDQDKFDLMCVNRYQGEIPEHAWRIECEFRTATLAKKGHRLRNLDVVLGNLSDVIQWCTGAWCRVVAERTEGHTERDDALPFWSSLSGAINLGESQPVGEVTPQAKPAKLSKAASSMLARAVAMIGWTGKEEAFDEVSDFFAALGDSLGVSIDFRSKVYEVNAELVAKGYHKGLVDLELDTSFDVAGLDEEQWDEVQQELDSGKSLWFRTRDFDYPVR